jgi:hypothetical protein
MGFELAWVTDRDLDFSVREFAQRLMDDAIQNLRTDGEIASVAFVVTDRSVHCLGVEIGEEDDKAEIYQSVIAYAREHYATMIVTLNEAYWGPADDPDYYPGKFQAEFGKQGIYVTVSGPGVKNIALLAPFQRQGKSFIFDERQELSEASLGLMVGWADDDIKAVQ